MTLKYIANIHQIREYDLAGVLCYLVAFFSAITADYGNSY